jgi:prolipoprotein diacylglyceryltransferase
MPGLLAAYQIMVRGPSTRSRQRRPIINGLIISGAGGLIGGRLYHVIDQWSLYKDDPLTILLPIALP